MRIGGAGPTGTRARPVLTGRALGLGVLVVLLVVVLASPVKRYLGSRQDVAQAARQLQQDRAQLATLAKEKARWADPGYIQAQARSRLQFAMPGDTVYIVADKGQRSDIERSRGAKSPSVVTGRAWNDRLWDSIHAASR